MQIKYLLCSLMFFLGGFLIAMERPAGEMELSGDASPRIGSIPEWVTPDMYYTTYLRPAFADIGKTMQMFLLLKDGSIVLLIPERTEVTPEAKFNIEGDTLYKVGIPWIAVHALSIVTDPDRGEVSPITIEFPEGSVINFEGSREGSIEDFPYKVIAQKELISIK